MALVHTEQRVLSSPEMGAANVVLLAQMQDSKTEKQAMAKWSRLQTLLKQQLHILGKPVSRTASLTSVKKCWQNTGSFHYETTWHEETEI